MYGDREWSAVARARSKTAWSGVEISPGLSLGISDLACTAVSPILTYKQPGTGRWEVGRGERVPRLDRTEKIIRATVLLQSCHRPKRRLRNLRSGWKRNAREPSVYWERFAGQRP